MVLTLGQEELLATVALTFGQEELFFFFFSGLVLWMSRIGCGSGLDGWTGGTGHSSEILGPGGMVILNGLDIWTSGIGHSHGSH